MNVMVCCRHTYSCQTWNINKLQQERIRSAYTNLLRRMVRGGFKRKVDENDEDTYELVLSNRTILEICGPENVLDYVKQMQENYLGHIARQKNDSIMKRLLFNADQNKKRGRPMKTLEDHVLDGKSANSFYREALKKRKKDMVGSGCNHSKRAPASKS